VVLREKRRPGGWDRLPGWSWKTTRLTAESPAETIRPIVAGFRCEAQRPGGDETGFPREETEFAFPGEFRSKVPVSDGARTAFPTLPRLPLQPARPPNFAPPAAPLADPGHGGYGRCSNLLAEANGAR
jgi:hypothetical protein